MANAGRNGKNRFHLDEWQKLNWLRLIRSQNVGPVTFRQLILHYGTAEKAIEALPELAARGGAAARIRICPINDAEAEMVRCEKHGIRLVAMGEPEYPALLRKTDYSPPILCVKGNPGVLTKRTVAMVGSRNASASGAKLAHRFASQLGEAGYVTVSGLARGIDTAVHKASLQSGTIAVFAGGLDHVFPEENRDLSEQIIDTDGALVSEMPVGWKPRSKDFPRRNRIVTGLAAGVVVIEAARRSGSLISARLANETGRVVLAVPGSPLDPRSEGTNSLIKQGATLVTCVEDILEAIGPIDDRAPGFDFEMDETANHVNETIVHERDLNTPAITDDSIRQSVIAALGPSPTGVDDILHFTGAGTGDVQLVLMELSLAGRIERHSGNRVSLITG